MIGIAIGCGIVLAFLAWIIFALSTAPVINCSNPHCGGCMGPCPFKLEDGDDPHEH